MLKSRSVRAAASVALCALVLGLAACSSSESSTSTTAKEGKSTSTTNPYGAGVVDPPGPTDVVLTVTGPGGSKTFTMDQLKALGTKDVTIDEPFVKRRIAFTGVPMEAIFATVGISGDVRVSTAALNEYVYDKSTAADFTGSDGLIAVATGAGGHAGIKHPFALIQEIREWFDGPLLLSGAIGTGDGILAAQACGADLAYIGSIFIATEEARAADAYKQAIVAGTSDDIVYTNLFTGVHGNYLKPSIVAAGLDPDKLPESDPSKMNFGGGAAAKAWKDIWGCGQGIGAVKAVQPTAAVVDRLEREYRAARERLSLPR